LTGRAHPGNINRNKKHENKQTDRRTKYNVKCGVLEKKKNNDGQQEYVKCGLCLTVATYIVGRICDTMHKKDF